MLKIKIFGCYCKVSSGLIANLSKITYISVIFRKKKQKEKQFSVLLPTVSFLAFTERENVLK